MSSVSRIGGAKASDLGLDELRDKELLQEFEQPGGMPALCTTGASPRRAAGSQNVSRSRWIEVATLRSAVLRSQLNSPVGLSVPTVRRWRARFAAEHLDEPRRDGPGRSVMSLGRARARHDAGKRPS